MKSKIDHKKLEKLIKDILKSFDPKAKVEITVGETIGVNIESEMSGQLIGRFGQTLEALQHLIRLAANKLAGEPIKLALDVQGYKASKNRELEELALSVAENVSKSGYPQSLRPMNSYERRVIHTALTDFSGIEVSSVGEEPNRYIEIKPR